MRFSGPMAQANHFERNRAIETFLPGAINDALAAATDYLQQFVVAKIAECPRAARLHFRRARRSRPTCVRRFVGFISGQIKAGLKEASGTKAFRRVGKNFRSAFSTNPRCAAAHDGRVACAVPIMYCEGFHHTLRSQPNYQME